jgi:polyisoprenoid-binding protein YceI
MRLIIVALALALSACATTPGASSSAPPFSSTTEPAVTATAPANYPVAVDLPAGTYRLDARHASVLFRIQHEHMHWFTARFDTKDATLVFNPQDPSQSHLTASVDATSVNTGVPGQTNNAFDHAVGRALGSDAQPQITFTSTAIQRTGQFTARITGDLAMNGQTHPATLDATFDGGAIDPLRGGNQVLGFSAHGVIDRSQWGVTQWSSVTGNDVQIVIEAELVKS